MTEEMIRIEPDPGEPVPDIEIGSEENASAEEVPEYGCPDGTAAQSAAPPKKKKRKNAKWIFLFLLVAAGGILLMLKPWRPGISSRLFGIKTYQSPHDEDGDGIDDQTDILEGARKYVSKHPEYRSEYYPGGYPTDNYGVCTDVVGAALLNAGYDLMELVHEDVLESPESYPHAESIAIDFRRVVNLDVWFRRNAAYTLSTDIRETDQWQGGDIVTFEGHIGIISDRRDRDGVPYVIHHGREGQTSYEEDTLRQRSDIIGHYRMS